MSSSSLDWTSYSDAYDADNDVDVADCWPLEAMSCEDVMRPSRRSVVVVVVVVVELVVGVGVAED